MSCFKIFLLVSIGFGNIIVKKTANHAKVNIFQVALRNSLREVPRELLYVRRGTWDSQM